MVVSVAIGYSQSCGTGAKMDRPKEEKKNLRWLRRRFSDRHFRRRAHTSTEIDGNAATEERFTATDDRGAVVSAENSSLLKSEKDDYQDAWEAEDLVVTLRAMTN